MRLVLINRRLRQILSRSATCAHSAHKLRTTAWNQWYHTDPNWDRIKLKRTQKPSTTRHSLDRKSMCRSIEMMMILMTQINSKRSISVPPTVSLAPPNSTVVVAPSMLIRFSRSSRGGRMNPDF